MKHIAALLVVVGCAAAERPQVGEDAAIGRNDAPRVFDAPQSDAPQLIDAPMVDAPMIDAPPMIDACVPNAVEKLANPSFDLAPQGVNWTEIQYLSTEKLVVTGTFAQSGAGFALLGGYYADFPGDTADDYLYQEFIVPQNTTQLVVSGYLYVETEEGTTVPYDEAYLGFLFPDAPATTPIIVLQLDNTDAPNASSWTPFSVTIPQNLSGQRLRFQMESHNDYDLRTAFAFDTLSVRAMSGCP